MILSDRDIKNAIRGGGIKIKPYDKKSVQPASYDLHLDNEFVIFHYGKSMFIDTKKPVDQLMKRFKENDFVLYPGQMILGATEEIVELDKWTAGRVEGKSSLARLGLMIHITAGFIDPGFKGKITLEMVNMSSLPIKLYHKMPIAQICFFETKSPVEFPYGHPRRNNKYQKSRKVEISKNHLNFK